MEPIHPLFKLSPAHLADLAWKDLVARMQCPVMVGCGAEGARIVEVLGAFRYLIEPAQHRVHMAYGRGNGVFVRGGDQDWVSLDPLLPGDQWVGLFLHNWIVGRMTDLPAAAASATTRSLVRSHARDILEWRVREAGFAQRLRPRIELALQIDPDILRWMRLGRPDQADEVLNTRDYSTIWRYALRFRQLERENPHLVRAYAGAILGGAQSIGDPARDLKDCFHCAGIGKAGWKLLCNTPAEAFRVPLRMASNDFTVPVYAWVIETFLAAGSVLPDAVLERLIAPHFREPRRRSFLERCEDEALPEWKSFLRSLARRVSAIASDAQMARFLDEEMGPVHDWLDATAPTITSNQAHAGWPWLLRQAREWERSQGEKALARRTTHQWAPPLVRFDSGLLSAVALCDSYELWQEGQAMRHCVRMYATACLEGRIAVYSIRRRSDDERLATVALKPGDGHWVVNQVRVFANRAGGPELNAFAQELAGACGVTAHADSIGDTLVDLEEAAGVPAASISSLFKVIPGNGGVAN